MTTAQRTDLEDAPLPPFPEGWYFIETRQVIEKAKLISKTWMGQEIIAWTDGEGAICVAEAHCPHLGANLSPEVGGRVVNGQLVCPFHGFAYDATGQCISTPYTNPPPTARLRLIEIREHTGLIFGWWGIDRRPPQWPMPDEQEDTEGWSSLERRSVQFAGHPQETTENSVDYSHLNYVHGFGGVSRTAPLVIEGHRLESRFDFQTTKPVTRLGHVTFDISATTLVYGLGVSYVEIRNTKRRHQRGDDAVLAGEGNQESKAVLRGVGVPAEEVPRSLDKQVHRRQPDSGREEGRNHLEPQEVPITAAPFQA